MPTVEDKTDGPWLFVTTSPACSRPSKAQRSHVRRRVMREIGFSRRKKSRLHESTSVKEEEHHSTKKTITTSSFDKMDEWTDRIGGSIYTSIPSGLEIGLGYPTPLESNARLILSHSKYSWILTTDYISHIYKCSPTSSPPTCAFTATNGSRPQSATHQPLTRC